MTELVVLPDPSDLSWGSRLEALTHLPATSVVVEHWVRAEPVHLGVDEPVASGWVECPVQGVTPPVKRSTATNCMEEPSLLYKPVSWRERSVNSNV